MVLDFGEFFLSVGISNHDTYHCQSWSSRIIAQQVGVRNAGGSGKVIVEDSTLTPLHSMPFQDKLQNALGEQHPCQRVDVLVVGFPQMQIQLTDSLISPSKWMCWKSF